VLFLHPPRSTQGMDVETRWFRSSWVDRVFWGGCWSDVNRLLYVHILLYYYAAIFLYVSIYYILYLHLIIYIWFISPSLIWIFCSTKSFPFAQVQWRYYDLPGRSSLFLRLSRWSNKPWHTVEGRSRSKRGLFWGCGMDPPSVPIDIWYMMLKWYNDIQNKYPWDTLQNMTDL